MRSPSALSLLVLTVSLPLSAFAAEAVEPPAETPRTNMKSLLRARIAEDARKAEARPGETKPSSSTPPPATEGTPAPAAAGAATPGKAGAASTPTRKETPKEPATVLPKVEVRKDRITVLDQQLAKQEQDIARERKNLKPSEADLALNDLKVAQPLSIFGGESAQFRQRVASERVQLMEAEKDIIEAIARARTKAEKAELQKQLDEIRTFRRELDKTLR